VLGLLILFIPLVIEDEIAIANLARPHLHVAPERRPDILVYYAFEADLGMIAEKPHLPVGREISLGVEAYKAARIARLPKQVLEGASAGAEPFAGIDVEDPRATTEVEGHVAGGGKVILPWHRVEARPGCARDLRRPICRPSINDDDLVCHAADRAQAFPKEALLVTDNQRG